ncbi:unnamed protein product [Pedinophyceae sp. YPF-701]|nr:unnamed protein product [Pedinophyceae sp. YPF-701]
MAFEGSARVLAAAAEVAKSEPADDKIVSAQILILWVLLLVCVIVAYFIKRYRVTAITPSAAALLIGILFGAALRAAPKLQDLAEGLRFDAQIFFYGLLPPIVFGAGFNLKKRSFFRNGFEILCLAVPGTCISALLFGASTMALSKVGAIDQALLGKKPYVTSMIYGALMAATDPVATLSVFDGVAVPSTLYSLVFGEAVLNDAVALVLFKAFVEYYRLPPEESEISGWASLAKDGLDIAARSVGIMLGSFAVGVTISLAAALLLRRLAMSRAEYEMDGSMYEACLVALSGYMVYLAAEALELSGIVALFFAGVVHSHYTYYSLHADAAVTLRRMVDSGAFLCEIFVFGYMGTQLVGVRHVWDIGLVASVIPLCLLTRAANVVPMTALAQWATKRWLPANIRVMQWASGLRGAMAYGMAVNMPSFDPYHSDERTANPAIESTVLFAAVFSTLVFGSATRPLLNLLGLNLDHRDVRPAGARPRPTGDAPSERGRPGGADRVSDRRSLSPVSRDSTLTRGAAVSAHGPAPPRSKPPRRKTRGLLLWWRNIDEKAMKPLFGGLPRKSGNPAAAAAVAAGQAPPPVRPPIRSFLSFRRELGAALLGRVSTSVDAPADARPSVSTEPTPRPAPQREVSWRHGPHYHDAGGCFPEAESESDDDEVAGDARQGAGGYTMSAVIEGDEEAGEGLGEGLREALLRGGGAGPGPA